MTFPGNQFYNSLKSVEKNFDRGVVTLPVAVAACERVYIKIERVDMYLRQSMSADRLKSIIEISID